MLEVRAGDVLTVDAESLVVPIDGTLRPAVENLDRILGNVGRQFLRRFPDAQLLDALEAQLDLPLALGKAAPIEVQNAPFRTVVVVSTLHHAQALDHAAKATIARTAFANAVQEAVRAEAKSLATTVLQGGWRLSPQAAFGAMLQALPRAHGDEVAVTVCCLEAALAESLRGQAQSLGFLATPAGPVGGDGQ